MNRAPVLALCLLFSAPLMAQSDLPVTPDEARALYSNLSDMDYATKRDGAGDAFHFLRSFVPVYYLLLKKAPPAELKGLDAVNLSGWCVGDAHPENFGVLLSQDGLPKFTINDIDDAGPCPLVADTLRFFVSVQLFNPQLDIGAIFTKYLNGLNGQPITYSAPVRAMAEHAAGKIDPDGRLLKDPRHFKRFDGLSETTMDENSGIQTIVTQQFDVATQLIDALKYKKDAGGSGGMMRYLALLFVPRLEHPEQHPAIVEFKEIQAAGITPLASAEVPPPKERIEKTIQVEQGNDASEVYRIVNLMGRDMFLCPVVEGDTGVDLNALKAREILPVLEDEAATLGRIHIRAAADLNAYRDLMAKYDKDTWLRIVRAVADQMTAEYKGIKGI